MQRLCLCRRSRGTNSIRFGTQKVIPIQGLVEDSTKIFRTCVEESRVGRSGDLLCILLKRVNAL